MMKRLTLLTVILVLTVLVQLSAPPVQAEVSIPDAELAAVIREVLGLPAGAAITADAMRNLTWLKAEGRGIADLTGLEHAVNLTGLGLSTSMIDGERRRNPISNVLPLASLTNLEWLSLRVTAVSDVSALAGLTNLRQLGLSETGVSDVSALARLTNLKELALWRTAVSDVSALASLTNLERLGLGGTAVSDVSVLAHLTNLEWLELGSTDVSDVSVLASLTNLEWLSLRVTAVSDVSALAHLTNLEWLELGWTDVSDVSALASLTNLRVLELRDTNVSDVSALVSLTNLKTLSLSDTGVSDIAALARLTNLEELDLRGCPLNVAAHQTDIPAIQANGTEVAFDPFKPIHLPGVPSLVSLIYFRPSDKPVRPNVDTEIDALIKEAQRFFADEMERHGFGRKTFQFEADANGNAVVHHVNGKFPYAHYQQNRSWDEEINEQVYIPRNSITVIMIDTFGEEKLPAEVCGHGGGRPYGDGSADIYCWHWSTIAHELGHAFGMGYHDFRDDRYLMSYGHLYEELSSCFAAWLDVHPAFNPTVVRIGTRATIQMLSATLAAPPNAIRLRFTVTAPAGSLYQARLLTPEKRTLDGYAFNSGGLIGCKRIDGNPTSSTVEFVTTALAPDTEWVNLHIIGIDGDIVGRKRFPIDVASLADVNRDGVTNMADLAIVSQLVAQTMGEPVENPRADVNGDGVVDGEDFALVAAHLGEGEAAAPSQAALPAGLTLEKVEWALNFLYAENTGSPAFRRGIAKLEGFLALLVPDKTVLLANYPNPFNPETWIPYQLSEPAEVTVTIYAANGAVVRRLDLGHRRAGSYESRGRAAYWDGRNAQGESVASGVYFYTLQAGDFKATRKMVIRK